MRKIGAVVYAGCFAVLSLAQNSPSGSGGARALSSGDRKFAMTVAQTDLAEIQIGNLALQKSNDPQVKQIAQRQIDDHTKTSEALKQIAATKGLTPPTETKTKHKALAAKLESESGKDFDKDFIKANSIDHHRVIKDFEK